MAMVLIRYLAFEEFEASAAKELLLAVLKFVRFQFLRGNKFHLAFFTFLCYIL